MSLRHLLLPTRETRNIDLLMHYCYWTGVEATRLPEGEDWTLPDGCALTNAAVHGGTTFCRSVAARLGGRVLEPPDDFLPTLPFEYVRRRIDLNPLRQARAIREPKFIKPVNDKHFPAAVYSSGADITAVASLDDITTLISDPVTWECEFRMFVRDYQVRAFSPYQPADAPAPTPEQGEAARAFCQTLLNDKRIELPRAVVLDVGWILVTGWAVVEANTSVMSSIYDCDPGAVLEVLEYGLTQVADE